MKIRILYEAELDLLDGYKFYEMQAPGLGDYFLDSLYAEIDSLQLYSRRTSFISDTIDFWPAVFPLPCSTALTQTGSMFGPSSIADRIQTKQRND